MVFFISSFLFVVFLALVVSGDVPEEPVVSKKSGLLYERRLIERHITVRCFSFSVHSRVSLYFYLLLFFVAEKIFT